MSSKPYTKREIDLIMDRMSVHHKTTTDWLEKIDAKVEYTNGKVKRIIVAIIIMVSIGIGLGFREITPLILKLLV